VYVVSGGVYIDIDHIEDVLDGEEDALAALLRAT
jgi:hypothetical protein